MAYELRCDNAVCGVVLERGDTGRPSLSPKRHIYCKRCTALVEAVEEQVRREVTAKALVLAGEVEEIRQRLMREMWPVQTSEDQSPREGLSIYPRIG